MMRLLFVHGRAIVCAVGVFTMLIGISSDVLGADEEQIQRHRNRARAHYENEHYKLSAEAYREYFANRRS